MLQKGTKRLAKALGVIKGDEGSKRFALDDKAAMKGEFFMDTTEDEADIVRQIIDAQNYFEVLEVDPNDDLDKNEHLLRESYMNKCRLLNPDRCNHPRLEEAFEKLSKAYDTLCDPAQRLEHKYDHFGGRPVPANANPFGDFFNLFGGDQGFPQGQVIRLPGGTTLGHGQQIVVRLPQTAQRAPGGNRLDQNLAAEMSLMNGMLRGIQMEEQRRAQRRAAAEPDDIFGLGQLFDQIGLSRLNQRPPATLQRIAENEQQLAARERQRREAEDQRRAAREAAEQRRAARLAAEQRRAARAANVRANQNTNNVRAEANEERRGVDTTGMPEDFLGGLLRTLFADEFPPRQRSARRRQPNRNQAPVAAVEEPADTEVEEEEERPTPPRPRDPFQELFNFPPISRRNQRRTEEPNPMSFFDAIFDDMNREMAEMEARRRQAIRRQEQRQQRRERRRAERENTRNAMDAGLESLRRMGFEDDDRNRAALTAANGNVDAAVHLLLNP